MRQKLKNIDFTLFIIPILLTGFGAVMIYSASMVAAPVLLGTSPYHFLKKQIMWGTIGFGLMFFFTMFPYRHLQRMTKIIVMTMILLLVGLFFFGKNVNNAVSWYDLKFMSFQPAEFVKIGLIIYLSSVYAKKQQYIGDFGKAVIPPLI